MYYKASLDGLARVITTFCLVIFVVGVGVTLSRRPQANSFGHEIFIRGGIIVLILATGFGCFLLRPKGYRLNEDSLTIIRPGKSFSILLSEMEAVNEVNKSNLGFLTRTFAVGGVFGYFGRYYSSSLGTLYLYTTQRRNRILIITKAGLKLIISPDDISLLENLRGRLKSSK